MSIQTTPPPISDLGLSSVNGTHPVKANPELIALSPQEEVGKLIQKYGSPEAALEKLKNGAPETAGWGVVLLYIILAILERIVGSS